MNDWVFATRLPCVTTTPFGLLVLPLVNCRKQMSSCVSAGGAQPAGGEGSPSKACVTSTMVGLPQSCSRTRSTTLRLASMQNTTRALDVRMMWASTST